MEVCLTERNILFMILIYLLLAIFAIVTVILILMMCGVIK